MAERVLLQFMVADPSDPEAPTDGLLAGFDYPAVWMVQDGPLTAGPAQRRVVVTDHDPATGTLRPGPDLVAPASGKGPWRYAIADPSDPDSAGFRPVSVFGAVMRTIQMFEERDVLGRPVVWFGTGPLRLIPEAGMAANAEYTRRGQALRFYSFAVDDPAGGSRLAHTCLSPDIVAHETAHAILDGIAPDLFDGQSPQALALHETIADLTTVIFAVRTDRLRRKVLDRTGGDLRQSRSFSGFAQTLGHAAGHPARDLANGQTMAGVAAQPHALSLVLSGALYALLLHACRRLQGDAAGKPDWDFDDLDAASFSTSGKSLTTAANLMKRVAFRALDYLPPGNICFADYARAVLAADAGSNPQDGWVREFLMAEFVRRGIVADAGELAPVPHGITLEQGLDLDALVQDDAAARRFAEANRDAMMIPPGKAFTLRPRLDAVKRTYRGALGPGALHEILFRVVWSDIEPVNFGHGITQEVATPYGTLLAIDRRSRCVHAMLTTAPAHPTQKYAATATNRGMRARFLRACRERGLLAAGSPHVQFEEGVMQIGGLGHSLHASAGEGL